MTKQRKLVKKVLLFTLFLLTALLVYPTSFIRKEALGQGSYLPDQFLVKLKEKVTLDIVGGVLETGITSIDSKNALYGVYDGSRVFSDYAPSMEDAQLLKSVGLDRIYLFKTPYPNIPAIVAAYQSDPNVVYAEPNNINTPDTTPNDPDFSYQYALDNTGQTVKGVKGKKDADIDAPEGWDYQKGSPDTVIAIIDSGIDLDHEDLAANIWQNPGETGTDASGNDKRYNGIDDDGNNYIDDYQGWDFVGNDNNPNDSSGHGTKVAGVASAVTNNNKGIAGVAWNCALMALRVNNAEDDAKAIKYATNNGADVINMSFDNPSNTIKNALIYAYQKNVVLVASSGNDGSASPQYPAAWEESNVKVIAVGATNNKDQRRSSSNYGSWLDVVAPGDNIYTTTYNGSYYWDSGTSFSAPAVAGLASLIKTKIPSISNEDLYRWIFNGADDLGAEGKDIYYGHGRINMDNTLYTLPPCQMMWNPSTGVTTCLCSAPCPHSWCPANPQQPLILIPADASLEEIQLYALELESDSALIPPISANQQLVSSVYELGPSGITFNKPVTITLPYSPAANPNLIDVYWHDGTSWQRITSGRSVNTAAHTISVAISHFSPFSAQQSLIMGHNIPWFIFVMVSLILAGCYLLFRSKGLSQTKQ